MILKFSATVFLGDNFVAKVPYTVTLQLGSENILTSGPPELPDSFDMKDAEITKKVNDLTTTYCIEDCMYDGELSVTEAFEVSALDTLFGLAADNGLVKFTN